MNKLEKEYLLNELVELKIKINMSPSYVLKESVNSIMQYIIDNTK